MSGPVLTFPRGVTREQAGSYICQATNIHGLRQAKTVVRVDFPPSCQISVTRHQAALRLHCRAEGSPEDFSFSWRRNNLSVSHFSGIIKKDNSNFGKISLHTLYL